MKMRLDQSKVPSQKLLRIGGGGGRGVNIPGR